MEYARQSLALVNQGLYAEGYLLAGRGLQFDDESSDLHYLRAVSAADQQPRTQEVVNHLIRATSLASWRLIDPQDGLRSTVAVLLRIGDFSGAAAMLEDHELRVAADYRMQAQLLRATGRFVEADAVYRAGRRRFPHHAGLFRFGLSLDLVAEPDERLWLDRHVARTADYRAALLDFILISPAAEERRELLERYFDLGGSHPTAYAVALASDLGQAYDQFVEAGAYRDRTALSIAAEAVAGSRFEDELASLMGGFSGTIVEDRNRDGFYESLLEVEAGLPATWVVDRETDGETEWTVSFRAGVPTEATYEAAGRGHHVAYLDYPEVAWVCFPDLPEKPRYHLRPQSIDFVVVPTELVRLADPLTLATSIDLVERPSVMSQAKAAALAYLVEFHDENGRPRAHAIYDDGLPIRRFEDESGDGTIDHVVEYADGTRIAAVRDPDEDGYFEVTEQYQDDNLVLRLVDEDDDFLIEYAEAPNQPATYSWDTNRDGTVDVREIEIGRNRVLREFSTSQPGVFDISFETLQRAVSP